MADIRINALATTAASTASDDFVAVDGSANGTRKLNAYSPTFGGNLTVNGTDVKINNSTGYVYVDGGSSLTGFELLRSSNAVVLYTANVERLRVNSTGLTTLAGNLTVSGTGTSSVAGNLQIGGAPNIAPSTIDRYSSVNVTNVADFPAFSLSVADGSKNVRGSMYIDSSTTQEQFAWDFSYSSASFPQYKWKIAGTTLATLRDNGNFILSSTGTDGGQKLQVDGNSGFLGHLEIPADKHIYVKQGNPLRWSSDGLSTGTVRADIYADSGAALYFRTNGTTQALTLDSSQNATFAGNVTIAASKVFTHNGQNGYALALSTTADRAFKFEGASSGNDYTTSFTNAGAGKHNLSCSGSIAIGNTVNTVSPTSPNRTITMVIGGTTYYIHAKTTND